ncbi:MAG: hypothetical protein A2103_04230 [Gammaproteobacteria bacterium GWF2_41_13]|nr:MAG: hypothetical protein A2103_04230 [Gammaproteobacteria bacterium GWF2_41_13]
MIAWMKRKLRWVKRAFRKITFRLDNFENISRDELLCREYIEYALIDKSKRPRENLIKTMSKGCGVLEEIGVKYWLGRGTLLGFYRDNDFLPNDIDIDIDVYTDKDIYKIIQKMPFEVLFVTNCRGHYMQLAFFDRETNIIFDIFFYFESGDKWYNRNCFGYFWLPSNQFDKLGIMNFDGRNYPVPLDSEWYCRFWYGEDWKTPKKQSADWTIEYRNNCKGFIFEGVKNVTDLCYYRDDAETRC